MIECCEPATKIRTNLPCLRWFIAFMLFTAYFAPMLFLPRKA